MQNFKFNRKNRLKTIYVASKDQLTDQTYIKRLWLAARNMHISRRQWPNVIAYVIYNFDGVILAPDERPWPIPHIDDVFGDPRWFSYYFEENDGEPLRKVRQKERLRVIDLYFRIAKPHIQRHFSHKNTGQ